MRWSCVLASARPTAAERACGRHTSRRSAPPLQTRSPGREGGRPARAPSGAPPAAHGCEWVSHVCLALRSVRVCVVFSGSESVLLSCSNSPSWPNRSRGLVSVVTHGCEWVSTARPSTGAVPHAGLLTSSRVCRFHAAHARQGAWPPTRRHVISASANWRFVFKSLRCKNAQASDQRKCELAFCVQIPSL